MSDPEDTLELKWWMLAGSLVAGVLSLLSSQQMSLIPTASIVLSGIGLGLAVLARPPSRFLGLFVLYLMCLVLNAVLVLLYLWGLIGYLV